MKKFQTILLIIFTIGALIAVMIFAGYIPTPKSTKDFKGTGTVVIWGTVNDPEFISYMNSLAEGITDFTIKYVPISKTSYESELIEAFADGTAPDLFMVDNDNLSRFNKQIEPISYNIFPQKTLLNSYAPAFSLFSTGDGILAYPLLINPLVLYYNKTLLANEGIANPPVYWDELNSMAEDLNKRDATGAFLQSTISLGRFENNIHAKDIISLMLLQIGNPIVSLNKSGYYFSTLGTHSTSLGLSLPAVITFFTDFSSPDTFVYSWNKGLPDATSAFLTERSVFYIGFADELFKLQARNPNLSLFVTNVPQPRGFKTQKTYAHLTGLALSKNSKNKPTAILTAQGLTNKENAAQIARILSLPSVYADDLQKNPDPSLAYQDIMQSSALRSFAWLDPDSKETYAIFRELTLNVLAGGADASDGIYERAQSNMQFLLEKFNVPADNTSSVSTPGL